MPVQAAFIDEPSREGLVAGLLMLRRTALGARPKMVWIALSAVWRRTALGAVWSRTALGAVWRRTALGARQKS
eukprot:5642279-Pleurochrysis_carterae.AAC.1